MRFLPQDEVFADEAAARRFIIGYLETTKALPYCRCAVVRKADGSWLGWCGLKLHPDGQTDLGFRLHEEYWGQGYATEAGKQWLRWGKDKAGLEEIIAQTTSGNRGSQRVLEKLGFERTPDTDYDEDGFRWRRYVRRLG